MILESKKGSRVDHFSTREIKIITYLKVFFFWEGERYEILRETSDGASRRGKELRLIEISTFYILLRLAGQHRKRTGNTVDDNGDKIYGEVQCARIFKNEKKENAFFFSIFKSSNQTVSRSSRQRNCSLIRSATMLKGRTEMRVFLESRNHPSSRSTKPLNRMDAI